MNIALDELKNVKSSKSSSKDVVVKQECEVTPRGRRAIAKLEAVASVADRSKPVKKEPLVDPVECILPTNDTTPNTTTFADSPADSPAESPTDSLADPPTDVASVSNNNAPGESCSPKKRHIPSSHYSAKRPKYSPGSLPDDLDNEYSSPFTRCSGTTGRIDNLPPAGDPTASTLADPRKLPEQVTSKAELEMTSISQSRSEIDEFVSTPPQKPSTTSRNADTAILENGDSVPDVSASTVPPPPVVKMGIVEALMRQELNDVSVVDDADSLLFQPGIVESLMNAARELRDDSTSPDPYDHLDPVTLDLAPTPSERGRSEANTPASIAFKPFLEPVNFQPPTDPSSGLVCETVAGHRIADRGQATITIVQSAICSQASRSSAFPSNPTTRGLLQNV